MTVLITGAGGFIASHLIRRCKADGHEVIGVDIKPLDEWTRGKAHANEEIQFDVTRSFWSGLKPFDQCYHLAAGSRIGPSFADPCGFVASNVTGTARTLEACVRNKAKMVYAASSTADGDLYASMYALTKHQGEQLCKAYQRLFSLRVAIARLYNVYGPREIDTGPYATVTGIFLRQWGLGEVLTVVGDGRQRRDFIHVDDVVDGLVAVMQRGKMISECGDYSLGTGNNLSLSELACLFSGGATTRSIPDRRGDTRDTKADVERTQRVLGWRALRRIEDHVAEAKERK